MFENMSFDTLQSYWWIIVSILGSVLVFLLFVQGGQSLLRTIGKTKDERTVIINTLGRKWELTFTTLVTFGGAFFASFPLFYATSFGGAYWVWMLLLFSFIIQAVSYEFRTKEGNLLGSKVYEAFMMINGVIAPLVIGTAVGTFFTGSEFSISDLNLSQWMNPNRGLEALFNITNVSLGITVLLLSRQLGAMYLIDAIDNSYIAEKARRTVKREALPFLLFAVTFLLLLITKDGFSVDPNGTVKMESYKYLHNIIAMPFVSTSLLTSLVLIILGIYKAAFKKSHKAFWMTSLGSILLVFSLFMIAGFHNTAFYPSIYNLQSSLTIHNSSSSKFTLTTMSYVSLFVPFVIAYIWYVWRAMGKKKLTIEEIKNDEHSY